MRGHWGELGSRYLLMRRGLRLQMTRSSYGTDISLFPALLLAFRSLLMYQPQIPLCVTASGASGSYCIWGRMSSRVECLLVTG